MSPVAMPVSSDSQFATLLEELRTAPTAPGNEALSSSWLVAYRFFSTDAKAAADRLAKQVAKDGYQHFECVYALLMTHPESLNINLQRFCYLYHSPCLCKQQEIRFRA